MTDDRLKNAWEHEGERRTSLKGLFGPSTVRDLGGLGVGKGWRCLERGAGGTFAAWLCDRVGGEMGAGAMGLDTSALIGLGALNPGIATHDRPGEPFDLTRGRGLLEHLRDPDAALKRHRTAASHCARYAGLILQSASARSSRDRRLRLSPRTRAPRCAVPAFRRQRTAPSSASARRLRTHQGVGVHSPSALAACPVLLITTTSKERIENGNWHPTACRPRKHRKARPDGAG